MNQFIKEGASALTAVWMDSDRQQGPINSAWNAVVFAAAAAAKKVNPELSTAAALEIGNQVLQAMQDASD